MPAAAVIPAPIAYIKVVAVKKLVVGLPGPVSGWVLGCLPLVGYLQTFLPDGPDTFPEDPTCSSLSCVAGLGTFTLKKLECSKQAYA